MVYVSVLHSSNDANIERDSHTNKVSICLVIFRLYITQHYRLTFYICVSNLG